MRMNEVLEKIKAFLVKKAKTLLASIKNFFKGAAVWIACGAVSVMFFLNIRKNNSDERPSNTFQKAEEDASSSFQKAKNEIEKTDPFALVASSSNAGSHLSNVKDEQRKFREN